MSNESNNQSHTVTFVGSTAEAIAKQSVAATTSIIEYHSAGHCLIVGDAQQALDVAPKLTGLGVTVVTVDSNTTALQKSLTENGIAVFTVPALSLLGHLGAFVAVAENQGDKVDLAVSVYRESGAFDLVLDISEEPLFDQLLPPFGYYHARDEQALNHALQEMPELVGEFEKPKYFDYNASICARSRSELSGCSNCMDVCTTNAISNDGEGVKVDPYLCQGCGTCATVCPSGAMSYAYPRPANAIDKTRNLLAEQDYHTLLLHSEEQQAEIDTLNLGAGTLSLHVEEVSAFGIDYWGSMLCAGVQHIVLAHDADSDNPNVAALLGQIDLFHQLLEGLGVETTVVQITKLDAIESLLGTLPTGSLLNGITPASFVTHNDKRQTIRTALDTLALQLKPLKANQPLPSTAPFGAIDVDAGACTLCMACVSVCPGKALLDGQDTPALRMIEANCLQCGLCESACPESAIVLKPGYTYDSIETRKIRTLNEEEPFNCIRCQKPFATAKLISTMFSKLDGHWMFADDKAKRRLKMCEDCRVKDIFEEDAKGIDVHKDNATDKA